MPSDLISAKSSAVPGAEPCTVQNKCILKYFSCAISSTHSHGEVGLTSVSLPRGDHSYFFAGYPAGLLSAL